MSADSSKFGPIVRKALEPIVRDELIPQLIAKNRDYLFKESTHQTPKFGFYYRQPKMDELVALYKRVGINDYDWKTFGPDIPEIQWEYHTFDPPEEKIWQPGTRYRKVTLPSGMENWFGEDFDAKAAGWKSGMAPFGRFGDKLITRQEGNQSVVEALGCPLDFCRCNEPMHTFWDKEVLLMRARLKLPELKKTHRYRLLVAGMSHVNAGDGYRLYVNGKLIKERTRGVGKREGARPEGVEIYEKWWPEFSKDEVVIAATSFLPIPGGRRSPGVKRQHFSVFMQQMEIPPLGEKEILNSIRAHPMLSSQWQTFQKGEVKDPGKGKYQWEGKFEKNESLEGSWVQLGQVSSMEAFDPKARIKSNRGWPLQNIELNQEGKTDSRLFMWSDDILMDLRTNQALKMTPKTIEGKEYLFIESGGFNAKHGPDWKSPLYVMTRK